MATNIRSSQDHKISPGPYLAKVVNHLDPTYMGSLEVAVIKGTPGQPKTESSNVIVKYCSPFFGSTSAAFEGNNSSNFNDVQKSYGFWMVPPDIGCTVMVIFIDGDINQGYWFGCVPDQFQNQMTPGIAASQYSAVGPGDEAKYGTKLLPVAEFHKASRDMSVPNPDTFTKAIHPFADRLVQQGLLLDTVRGVTSSSARREVPSAVFGISTPGPVDTSVNAPRKAIGFQDSSSVRIPTSRLGGSTFVMDDGDKDGQNELVRIRTRTGHQILLHNSSDLIYIANSKGTAWVELSSNGKIDIYAEDSISIHSEQDFNFRADRDINIEAGRNINMQAYSGIQMQSVDRFYLTCDNEGKINIANNLQVTAGSEIRMKSGDTTSFIAGVDFRAQAGTNLNLQAGTDINQSAGGAWKVGATGSTNITSGHHVETAGTIDMNGPAAATPIAAGANAAVVPTILDTFNLPARSAGSGWTNGNFYKAGNITSIMQRVPMHEPWDQHENINPAEFTPGRLDTQVNQPDDKKGSPTAGSTGSSPVNSSPVAVPLSKSAAANEQYLQAVLVNSGITSPIKLAAWMAQCKVESAGFRALKEFASGAEYEGRADLGNTQTGDGIRFKGRGFIQLTGRDVYKKMTSYFNAGIDFVTNPELVEQLEWASKSVVFFFNVYKKPGFKNRTMTQAYADTDTFWDDVNSVSALVNGGTNGLAQRQQYYAAYKANFQANGINPTTAPVDSSQKSG
jgi:predicted chitinase